MTDSAATSSAFASLGLSESLLKTLTTLGYEVPTPIQERTIPILLAGHDVIGQAQTGTGKTAAFALPILQKIDPALRATQALVLTPTRELAMQVADAVHSYAHGMPHISVLPVYGGAPIHPQIKRLERGAQIVVGTPGRLIDHLDRKTLRLDSIRVIVLDEADEMLKMGFIDDVEKILAAAPGKRQIALFSATMPPEIVRIAQRHLAGAKRVEIEHKPLNTPKIEQRFINISEGQKLEVLTQILELEENAATLIFKRTKTGAAELAERLDGRGFAAVAMHGDMKQAERENVIRRLRNGQIEIVVATDVAARGLDVEQITHVVNYDIPNDVEAYVHRIGRTGRAGRTGMATLFVTPRERRMMRDIERFTGLPIKPMKMPSKADVAARRINQLKDTLRKTIEEGELDLYMQLVEQLVEEGPHDIAEIAAAAARLAAVAKPIGAEKAQPQERPHPPLRGTLSQRERAVSSGSPLPLAGEGGPKGRVRDDSDEPRVRLSMSLGKNDGVRPADVVGSIANEADVPGRDIGPIDIRDDITYVTVPESYVEKILIKVGRAKFRGRAVNIRVAGADDGSGDRFEKRRGPRPPFGKPSFAGKARPERTGDRPDRKRFDSDTRGPKRFGSEAGPKRFAGPKRSGAGPKRFGGPKRGSR